MSHVAKKETEHIGAKEIILNFTNTSVIKIYEIVKN